LSPRIPIRAAAPDRFHSIGSIGTSGTNSTLSGKLYRASPAGSVGDIEFASDAIARDQLEVVTTITRSWNKQLRESGAWETIARLRSVLLAFFVGSLVLALSPSLAKADQTAYSDYCLTANIDTGPASNIFCFGGQQLFDTPHPTPNTLPTSGQFHQLTLKLAWSPTSVNGHSDGAYHPIGAGAIFYLKQGASIYCYMPAQTLLADSNWHNVTFDISLATDGNTGTHTSNCDIDFGSESLQYIELNSGGLVGAWTDTNVYTDGVSQQAVTCQGNCTSPNHSLWFTIITVFAQNGWRMDGYDASRTNRSVSTGPLTLPAFQPLIINAPSILARIGTDGSLLFLAGTVLSSYTNTGILKWSTSVPEISDAAIGPTGNIFVSSQAAASVIALSQTTGQPLWPFPFTSGLNGAAQTGSASLAIDSSDNIYLNMGVTGELTAINADGTLKWQNGLSFRSDVRPVLSYDESLALIPNTEFPGPDLPVGVTSEFYTATGQSGPDLPLFGLQNVAPWGTAYFTRSNFAFGLVGCTPGASCSVTAADTTYLGVSTFVGDHIIIAQVSNSTQPLLQAVDKNTGTVLWTGTEPVGGVFSDANGTLYAIALTTNDLVALNGHTGTQLWRQHFSSLPSVALLGDDGNLYVSVGTTVYKSGGASGAISVSTNLAAAAFTIAGPTSYLGNGTSFLQTNAPVGPYTISYSAVPGYITPPGKILTLATGGTITFTAAYQPLPANQITAALGGSSSRNLSPFTAEPVNAATGNYYLTSTDLAVPAKGLPFVLTRAYNSADPYTGSLGSGWTHSFNVILVENSDNSVSIKDIDGGVMAFAPTGGGSYAPATPGIFDALAENQDGSFTLTRKNQTKLNFSGLGRLTSIFDRNGNSQALSYDGVGNLASIVDSASRSYALSYDGGGHLLSVTDPIDRILRYGYDASGRLTSFTDPAGSVTQYSYDSNNRMVSATDSRGNVYLQNTYDPRGRVITQKNARNFATTFAYNTPSAGTTTVTDPLGNVTKEVVDSSLRLIQEINATGGTTSYGYNANNLRLTGTDPLGRVQSFTYDANGNTTSITDPNDKISTFTYDSKNDLLSSTDRLSRTTSFGYDSKGNLLTMMDAGGNTTAFTYDVFGEVLTSKDARNFTMSFQYDSAGDLTKATDPLGGTVSMTYDSAGRLTSVQNQLGKTATRTYDADNRLLAVTDPVGNSTQFQYDPNGNLVKITDANGKQTQYTYDTTNKLSQVTDANGSATQYQYNGNTDLTMITDAKSHSTTYAYDGLRRLATVTDPLGRQKHFSYDSVGNTTSTIDGNSKTNSFGYDPLNRLVSMALSDGKNVGYTYDAVGNRLAMADWRGTTNYVYDLLNRVTSIATPDGNTVGYSYDPVGNRATLTYPDGRVAHYAYDGLNRLTGVTDWASKTTSYTYDAASNLTGFTHPNGANSRGVFPRPAG